MHHWIDSLNHPFSQFLLLGALLLALGGLLLWLSVARGDDNKLTLAQALTEMRTGFIRGCRQGLRGYFAPLRLSPWINAWRAARSPGATWWAPFKAWLAEIERIIKGQAC